MRKIRLCIGSNDGENIVKSHMGDAEFFYIYDLFENSQNEFIEKRNNIARDMEHAKANKMAEIIKLVKDADLFVGQKKSPNFINIASRTKYQPVVIKEDKISDILIVLHRSFEKVHSFVTRRKNGEFFNTVLELE